ncbi:hypothetical protein GOV04_01035 [Candidatus Woesearchaeota archaeon]|nr:hypothetical protein [Candidatus Woesearchaeota archaeon]
MAEKTIVVDEKTVSFEGLFNLQDLFKVVNDWIYDKGYYGEEKKHEEIAEEHGKTINLKIEVPKPLTDYAKSVIEITFKAANITEEVIELDGHKTKLSKGSITLKLMASLITDYEDRWEGKPWMFLVRLFVDKFVYKFYTAKYEHVIEKDFKELHDCVKSFLNLQKTSYASNN